MRDSKGVNVNAEEGQQRRRCLALTTVMLILGAERYLHVHNACSACSEHRFPPPSPRTRYCVHYTAMVAYIIPSKHPQNTSRSKALGFEHVPPEEHDQI